GRLLHRRVASALTLRDAARAGGRTWGTDDDWSSVDADTSPCLAPFPLASGYRSRSSTTQASVGGHRRSRDSRRGEGWPSAHSIQVPGDRFPDLWSVQMRRAESLPYHMREGSCERHAVWGPFRGRNNSRGRT